jgi:hypothetical protein
MRFLSGRPNANRGQTQEVFTKPNTRGGKPWHILPVTNKPNTPQCGHTKNTAPAQVVQFFLFHIGQTNSKGSTRRFYLADPAPVEAAAGFSAYHVHATSVSLCGSPERKYHSIIEKNRSGLFSSLKELFPASTVAIPYLFFDPKPDLLLQKKHKSPEEACGNTDQSNDAFLFYMSCKTTLPFQKEN